jgi:RNA polymerase sigma-70 factor (ECF subfamily)
VNFVENIGSSTGALPGLLLTGFQSRSLKNSRMEPTDAVFVTRARTGDPDAFRALVERHSRALFALAYRMTGSEQDAEDVVQESFFRAYRQLRNFDERAAFGTWLYRIAVNCSLDVVRARKRRSEQPPAEPDEQDPVAELPSSEPGPERAAIGSELRGRMNAAMKRLSPIERSAFVLRHFEGMRIEEVSRALGCQPGAAKHSVFRAVQKLRRALEPAMSSPR